MYLKSDDNTIMRLVGGGGAGIQQQIETNMTIHFPCL